MKALYIKENDEDTINSLGGISHDGKKVVRK